MLRSPLRSPLNAVVKDVIAHPGNRLPFNKFISALLSKSGRVAAYYGESWDEILAYNAKQVAAGTPANCVAFEDSAGTIPLVAPLGAGKGCGLLLDRSLGLVRGPELITDPDFVVGISAIAGAYRGSVSHTAPGAVLTTTSVSGAAGIAAYCPDPLVSTPGYYDVLLDVTAMDSGQVAVLATSTAGNSGLSITNRFSVTAPGSYRAILYFSAGDTITISAVLSAIGKTITLGKISVRELRGHHRIQPSATARGEMSRRVNLLTGTETLATQSITTIATGSVLRFSGAGSVTLSGTATGTYAAGTHAITTTAGTLTLTVVGTVTQADCRYAADANIGKPYQWVIDPNNYDEEGFPAFLRRQTDDWSKTHINPNGATKVFALTAIQKMRDASAGIVLESSGNSNANNGCILLLAPNAPGTIAFRSNGTVVPTSSDFAGINYPTRTVIGGRGSISPPLSQCIVNGIEGPYITIDQGTGTYTEQDVFFGARAGTSMFVNDREYSPPLILFMQPGDPGLTSAEIARLTRQFNKSIKAF